MAFIALYFVYFLLLHSPSVVGPAYTPAAPQGSADPTPLTLLTLRKQGTLRCEGPFRDHRVWCYYPAVTKRCRCSSAAPPKRGPNLSSPANYQQRQIGRDYIYGATLKIRECCLVYNPNERLSVFAFCVSNELDGYTGLIVVFGITVSVATGLFVCVRTCGKFARKFFFFFLRTHV